ncbi:hypothetical protein C8R45DRAFT_946569 [Mycena sanguinolenta]|nr:hypothetical protein C8R45DRAFT_946569 [Mycena sanguinolenta]
MFFSASIAFSFLVSLSGIAVYSAPVARQDGGRQVCTGADGSGTCVPIADGQCFNVAPGNAGSLIQFNEDDDCFGFPSPDCVITTQQLIDGLGVFDLALAGAGNFAGNGILSVQC